jgi:parallel beta-helix repeat protein
MITMLVCFVGSMLSAAGAQTVIHVDDDAPAGGDGLSWSTAYDSLEIALAVAEPGDQIWVASGRYVGNFTLTRGVELYGGFAGTETELGQRDWTANETILDGNQTGSVVTSPPGATETTRINGFTITNGSGTLLGPYTLGGGVHLWESSPTIANNTITANSADAGGGLYLYECSPTITRNTIADNSADLYGGGLFLESSSGLLADNTITGNSGDAGGGLHLYMSSPRIERNTIADNNALRSGGGMRLEYSYPAIANNTIAGNNGGRLGGGLYLCFSSSGIINNAIIDNEAESGAGMYLRGSSARIASNTISGNHADEGGGLYLYFGFPEITNNTITSNVADEGGGLYLHPSDSYTHSPTIANTIIAFNSSGLYQSDIDSEPTLRHNCVYDNFDYDYSGLTDPTGVDGNISVDPMLAGPPGIDMHIQPDSPCVEAGTNAEVYGDFDMDGEARTQGTAVDIGADESDGTVWPPVPYPVVRVSPTGDDANDGSSWAVAKRTVQAAIDAASVRGGEVWVQASTYYEQITLCPFTYLYGGFAGSETTREERDWTANITTLDGQQQGSVVSVRAGQQISTIDGFTISNGRTDGAGGGVYVQGGSPTVANNTITGNTAIKGGGLCLISSSATVTNNTLTGNSADCGGGLYLASYTATIAYNTIVGNSADLGGGVYAEESAPTITNNTITNNGGAGLYFLNSAPTITANIINRNSAPDGGGVCLSSSTATITDNTIVGNGADDGGGLYLSSSSGTIANNTIIGNCASSGGGLFINSSSPTIVGNRISGNIADRQGGGLSVCRSSPTIENNTITGNDAASGGGLYLYTFSPTIVNNTITGNNADGGGGLYVDYALPTIANTIVSFNSSGVLLRGTSNTPSLWRNCVYGNQEYDYDGLADPTGIDGNISADPLLADLRYGNVHIQPDSPCVDAGSDVDVSTEFDMDGKPRIESAAVDIGADESDGTLWHAGPYVIVRVSPTGDDANNGSSWPLAKRTVQAGTNLASALGGEVWVQAGTYEECITLHPYAYLYGGFAGSETSQQERDWVSNITALDGQQQGSVVTARAGHRVSAIDGFTITNGTGTMSSSHTRGGGLYVDRSSPLITNNTITNSKAQDGGGMFLAESSAAILNNTFKGNTAADGGGLCLLDSSPTISDSRITSNAAICDGGGLLVSRFSSPTIANTAITGNTAEWGGGLYAYGALTTIANSTVINNSARAKGGGLYLSSGSPTIANTAIVGNSAPRGGGLYSSSSAMIANTIVAFNSSGIYRVPYSGTPTLRHNCVSGNTEYDYGGFCEGPTGTDGNISADPMFVLPPDAGPDGEWGTDDDDAGDLHLLSGSPCIDSGDNFAVPADELDLDGDGDATEPMPFDLDGRPRFVNDPSVPDTGEGTQPIVDMGAYERQAVLLDINPGRCPNQLNIRSNARVQIAVVGTDDFDVTQIDTGSLVLERADGLGGRIAACDHGHGKTISVRDAATPFLGDLCDCHRRRPDGIDDLVLSFHTRDMARELELWGIGPETPVMLTVRGQLLDGTPFDASDCILTNGGRPPNPGRLSPRHGKN